MSKWNFIWDAKNRKVTLESDTHIIKINADKIRKWFNKNDVDCKKVGEFKIMFLNGMSDIPKSYYTLKEKVSN